MRELSAKKGTRTIAGREEGGHRFCVLWMRSGYKGLRARCVSACKPFVVSFIIIIIITIIFDDLD